MLWNNSAFVMLRKTNVNEKLKQIVVYVVFVLLQLNKLCSPGEF